MSEKPLPPSMGGAAELLQISFDVLTASRVEAHMPVTPDHHQPFGQLHGGVSVVLAESAASVGGYLAAPTDKTAVGIEINANHMRAVSEGTVHAVAEPLHVGTSTHVWDVKIRDAEDRLVCVARCTLAIMPLPPA
ncbi:esterase [Longimonas halophila]|uniref:Esterase n=1 Tax=Longimonas halophila TaxID=1469170 RepID=A0A2H3NR06_9BACT|nr:hotdog fold thioesterase [Longimonas halophila]PEN05734.1 esterase [Longimonas halophila]